MTEKRLIKANVGRISYYNVMPIYYGIKEIAHPALEITTGVPSALNRLMLEKKLDISPVSTAAYAKNYQDWLILPDLSISCFGPVMSVCLACSRPMEELEGKHIILTRDSGSAAALVKWILAEKEICATFNEAAVNSPADVPSGDDAALAIGNAALSSAWNKAFPYVYDLGEEWRKMKNLPFVFALWAVRREFAESHSSEVSAASDLLYKSRAAGANHIDEIAKLVARKTGMTRKRANLYFSRLIYSLGKQEIAGLSAFFTGLAQKGLIQDLPEIRFFD